MKTRSLRILLAAAGALAAPLLFSVATSAGDPDPPIDAGAEPGDAGADADASTDGDAAPPPPPLPSYRVEAFTDDRSPEPKAKEWAMAPRVGLDRSRYLLFAEVEGPPSPIIPCEARRVREWMRIRCTVSTGAISLLGGNAEGLALRLDPVKHEDFPMFPEGGEIVFPVRRGDRREIEWLQVAFGYKGMNSVEPSFVLSEQWAPGDAHPLIVAQ